MRSWIDDVLPLAVLAVYALLSLWAMVQCSLGHQNQCEAVRSLAFFP